MEQNIEWNNKGTLPVQITRGGICVSDRIVTERVVYRAKARTF